MATTWQTITVRVERPPETTLDEYFADMRTWLDHHCIILTDFRGVTAPNGRGVFAAQFNNPRDALHFARRFSAQPAHIASRRSIIENTSSVRGSISAAIASITRSVSWLRTKLSPMRLNASPRLGALVARH
jgi:hypothetical protein